MLLPVVPAGRLGNPAQLAKPSLFVALLPRATTGITPPFTPDPPAKSLNRCVEAELISMPPLRVEGVLGVGDSVRRIRCLVADAGEVYVEGAFERWRQEAALRPAEPEAHLVERRRAECGVDREGGQALIQIVIVVDVANRSHTSGRDPFRELRIGVRSDGIVLPVPL